jgi:hypothetical protein
MSLTSLRTRPFYRIGRPESTGRPQPDGARGAQRLMLTLDAPRSRVRRRSRIGSAARCGQRAASVRKNALQALRAAEALIRHRGSEPPRRPTDWAPAYGKPQPERTSSGTRRRRIFPRVRPRRGGADPAPARHAPAGIRSGASAPQRHWPSASRFREAGTRPALVRSLRSGPRRVGMRLGGRRQAH